MAELHASRKRIVEAADSERRRLERNIHDGAQQQLVALSVMARLAETTADSDKERARAMLVQAQADATGALENLRDLARGIYPPLLAERGLAAALEAQARRSAVPVTVEADGLGRYPQDAEAAVYFCALEALQNVAKYASASRACVRLAGPSGRDDALEFSVTDDGAGFDSASAGYGTGLQGMADRLAALGGDLQVRSRARAGHHGDRAAARASAGAAAVTVRRTVLLATPLVALAVLLAADFALRANLTPAQAAPTACSSTWRSAPSRSAPRSPGR